MNISQTKLDLIQKITQIEDIKLLDKIQIFLNTSGASYNGELTEIPSLRNNKNTEFNDTENFTDYIKEWVKDM